MSDINFQQVTQVIGALGSIFGGQNQTQGTVPTYGQPQAYGQPQSYQPAVLQDTMQFGGGGSPADQVRSVYAQLLRRQPSDFELQMGSESIRFSGYQAFVDELRRKNNLGSGPAPAVQSQQPVYQQPQPVYQPPQPVYQQPQPVYQQPQPVYQQPQPVYQPPQPVYQPPQPVYQPPQPVYQQPQPVYPQPQPVFQQPQPGYQAQPGGPGTSLPMGPLPVFR